MSRHTPAPWQVMNEYDGATIVIANVDGETFSDGTFTFSYEFVCDTLPDDGDAEVAKANARLIAAAPDMLEALRPFADAANGFDGPNGKKGVPDSFHILNDLTVGHLRVARAAIAKAEGQS